MSSSRVWKLVVGALLVSLLSAACATAPRSDTTAGDPGFRAEGAGADDSREAASADAAAAVATRQAELVDRHLERMSLRQMVAQRFITFLPGRILDSQTKSDLAHNAPAGYILYPWNYETVADVRALTTELQATSLKHNPGVGALVCADQEGGRVQAFRFPELVRLPAAYWMGVHGDPDLVEAAAYITAVQLRWMGVNMSLSPVLDLYSEADSTIIGDRSYGPEPQLVSAIAAAYVRGFNRGGVIATAKHFPGHGPSTIDSHSRLPLVDLSLEELMATHVQPFASAVDAGIDVVMTAHILYPQLDPTYPATLSPLVIQGILRQDLGFTGVVISDGFEMGALSDNYDVGDSLRQAIRSGVDLILLYSSYELADMVNLVMAMVESGLLRRDEIEAGTRRILDLKARYGLLDEPFAAAEVAIE